MTDWYPEDARALVEPQGYPLTSVPSIAERIRKVHVGRGSWVFRGTTASAARATVAHARPIMRTRNVQARTALCHSFAQPLHGKRGC
jgi:hypothetical protein